MNDTTFARIRDIAAQIHAHHELEDEDLVLWLREAGCAEDEAERAIAFLPLAFARPILLKLGVTLSPDYLVSDRQGKLVRKRLGDEPLYVAALRVATATVTHGYATEGCAGATLTKPVFTSVLSRSPELAVASDLAVDDNFEGIVLTEVQLLRLTLGEPETKPRWRFWR